MTVMGVSNALAPFARFRAGGAPSVELAFLRSARFKRRSTALLFGAGRGRCAAQTGDAPGGGQKAENFWGRL